MVSDAAIRLTPDRTTDVVGVGANSVDYVAIVPAFPQPLSAVSKLRIRAHAVMCGGQTATCLATCARLGLAARYVGATGGDDNGRLVRDALGRLDIDISDLAIRQAARNQFAFVLIDERSGERVIFWDRDEGLNLQAGELPAAALASCRLVHVDDTDEDAAISAARIARAHGVPVTSDIDRVTGRTRELVRTVTVAIFAENVPLELAGYATDGSGSRPFDSVRAERRPGTNVARGKQAAGGRRKAAGGGRGGRTRTDGLDRVVAALSALPRRSEQILCVTLGSRGAVAIDDDGVHHQPAFHVQVADTTGAGDVFRGGFIYARLRGWPLDEQLRFANAAAALSCTRLGALASVPSLEEIQGLLRNATRRPYRPSACRSRRR